MVEKHRHAWFLLLTYLLTVMVSAIGVKGHNLELADKVHLAHTHDSFDDEHHEHQFHIGIFHFLGHIMEHLANNTCDFEDYNNSICLQEIELSAENNSEFDTSINLVNDSKRGCKEAHDHPPPDRIYLLSSAQYGVNNPLRAPPTKLFSLKA